MLLSIVTITYNNLSGLKKTLASVQAQIDFLLRSAPCPLYQKGACLDGAVAADLRFEHVVVDGASTDGTADYLAALAQSKVSDVRYSLRYVSEKDGGIYDAQNKGIALSKGYYCFFLNAGDCFCAPSVLSRMFEGMEVPNRISNTHTIIPSLSDNATAPTTTPSISDNPIALTTAPSISDNPTAPIAVASLPDFLYGDEVVVDATGKTVGISKGVVNPSFVDLYSGCMKHQATFIARYLFAHYGTYDTTMRICADWEWFLRVIGYHDVSMCYRPVSIAFFDNTGFSNCHPEIDAKETEEVLRRYLPCEKIQADYRFFAQYKLLRQAHDIPLLRFALRVVLKLAKILSPTK